MTSECDDDLLVHAHEAVMLAMKTLTQVGEHHEANIKRAEERIEQLQEEIERKQKYMQSEGAKRDAVYERARQLGEVMK